MTSIRLLFLAIVPIVVGACASPYRVVQAPHYRADLYPKTQTRSGVTVAIDEVKASDRVERLFGTDLIKQGILPVNVVVSNFGKQPMMLKPSDILLHQAGDVIDPLPVELVMASAKRQKTFLRSGTQAEVDKYFEEATFKETTLLPNETYRGVMFFALPPQKKPRDRFFASWSLYDDRGPKVRIGLTNLDSGQRVLFAPFAIRLPENAGSFSYWD